MTDDPGGDALRAAGASRGDPVGPPRLAVDGVSAGYGETRVLFGVALEVRAGEIVAVVGPSGAGKTTLIRAIAGLVPLAGGTICLDGARIDRLPPWRRAALGVTVVPEGRRLFADLTIAENLALGAYLPRARAALGETRALAERLFPLLRERPRVAVGVLSGGEQQMVALGRGLMADPRLLVLDDPFIGLARAAVAPLARALRDLAAARDTAILATGQHVRRLLRLADRAYLLEAGHVTAGGTGAALLADPGVRRALFEVPVVGEPRAGTEP